MTRNPDSIARTPDGRFDNDASHPEPAVALHRSTQEPAYGQEATIGVDRTDDLPWSISNTTHPVFFDEGTVWTPQDKADALNLTETPWGHTTQVYGVAEGITWVTTRSTSGVKLSDQRNSGINPALRNVDGWYEDEESYLEDDDYDAEYGAPQDVFRPAAIPMMHYPQEHMSSLADAWPSWDSAETVQSYAKKAVRRWHPDEYEAATGEVILPGESHVRDQTHIWSQQGTGRWPYQGGRCKDVSFKHVCPAY